MNIYAYTLDSLRKLVRNLQKENAELRLQLKNVTTASSETRLFDSDFEMEPEYDEDQGGRIISRYITADMATYFYKLFWGRQDVFAKRGSKGGYFPQCKNRWDANICPKQKKEKQNCSECINRAWIPLTQKAVIEHLVGLKEDGRDVIGVYPLFPDDTCRFLVFDFDNHEKGADQNDYANTNSEWQDEVNALRRMCLDNGIEPLVERSRSGKGAHVWILFSKPIKASLARKFGTLLLDKGALSVNIRSFTYYDRMYPAQDNTDGIGNLIALPLQGQALKSGNSAFVDEYWNAYPDQWDFLYNKAKRLSPEQIENYIAKWQSELSLDGCAIFASEKRPQSIKTYRERSWCGGVVYEEAAYPNLKFAKDGEIYTLDGFKTIVIGGAYSVDKYYRLAHGLSWFADEQPSKDIKATIESRLEEINWSVDIVLSHTCPAKYIPVEAFLPGLSQDTVDRSTEDWLDTIENRLNYKDWYCGHWHINKRIDRLHFLMECHECLPYRE